MKKIGVVILNYLAYQNTIDTVKAFEAQDKAGFEVFIVIVDNGSPNESFQMLRKEYSSRPDMAVVQTEKNLGFANGNNFGYRELLRHMKPDFTVISNDDILLPQQGLYAWISECSEKFHFAVLGPDIYSVHASFHQSPLPVFPQDEKIVKQRIRSLHHKLIKCRIKKLFRISSAYHLPVWKNPDYQAVHTDRTLHGAFQIFSDLYFEQYQEPYDPRTFLYLEEDILKLRCDKKNLSMVYSPEYQVHHLQAVATNMVHAENYNKNYFRTKNKLLSTKVYLKVLQTNKKDFV